MALLALVWVWWRPWSAWHLAHIHLRFCVAAVALGDIYLRLARQAWRLWHWAGSGGALGRRYSRLGRRRAWHLLTSTFVLCGRCGAWRHLPAFGVAGVARVALGWLWWRVWSPLVARGGAALLRGRRGACSHPPSFSVAAVALGDIYLRLAWQAVHLWHWAGSGGALGRCVARGFAWQAWRLLTFTFVLRTCGTGLGLVARLVAAGVATLCGTW